MGKTFGSFVARIMSGLLGNSNGQLSKYPHRTNNANGNSQLVKSPYSTMNGEAEGRIRGMATLAPRQVVPCHHADEEILQRPYGLVFLQDIGALRPASSLH